MAAGMLQLFLSLSALSLSTSATYLWERNNPPQPPCVYPYTEFVYSGCFHDSVSSRALPFMAEIEFNNATVEQCTAYCKGNNYRYAGLEYYGQCFCGASVHSASAPETDCNLPCNGDNSQACGGADRLSIYQDPTFPDADAIAISSDYLSLGCYTEGTSGQSLDYSQWDYLNISAMTTETCLNACGAKGYPFAGLEFGRECYCGVVLGNGTLATEESKCSTPCTGNSTQMCGGPDHLNLYVAKNLESTEPCGPPVLSSSSISSSTTTPPTSKSSTTLMTTTSKCHGWKCPHEPKSTTKCFGWHCPHEPKSTTKCHGWNCPHEPKSTTKCVGWNCPHEPKSTTSKCVGWKCPYEPTCVTPTPKPPKTTKKTSTVKTTSTKKWGYPPKSTPTPTSTKKHGYGW
ncbi:WSC-domain-containing protein [Lojkania enalia]|uniref:WSC-domain-containing protein n=1 Tax=Lojkania enalia TaxID=147567 RepID=A0A9P4KF23_9PLEO|nr:WSC-domain-containing protein [Didymosphaeria enalia]